MKRFYFLMCTLYIGACSAADEEKQSSQTLNDPFIHPCLTYNVDRDFNEAFALIKRNLPKVCTNEDGSPVNPEDPRRLAKLQTELRNNTHGSPLIGPSDNKFFRLVIYDNEKFVGITDFYENEKDHDAIKAHDGYIQNLLTHDNHTGKYSVLITAVFQKCKELGLKRLLHHLVNNNLRALPEYQALIAADFKEQAQTEFEKKWNVVRFEKQLTT